MQSVQKTFNTITSLFHYPKIIKDLKNTSSTIFFIFPSYQIGGAERVHADIMATVAHLSPTCIITSIPKNSGFKEDFSTSAKLIELKRWASKKSFIPIITKKIAQTINSKHNAIVFGSNTNFLYDLIPYLDEQVKVIDLTHAFTKHWSGVESYSLPYVKRIDQRIILGNKTLDNYKELYKQNNIDPTLINQFKIVPNQIRVLPDSIRKEKQLPLNILFISRNSWEKRPELFFQIVEKCRASKLPVTFTVVGDFPKYHEKFKTSIHFVGETSDKNILDTVYKSAHLLLITSIVEGFPMVIIEGMANGVVPISTNVGEIPDYISEDKETGILIDNTLSESEIVISFVEKIKSSVLQPDLLTHYGKKGFEMVKDRFSPRNFGIAYQEILTAPKI